MPGYFDQLPIGCDLGLPVASKPRPAAGSLDSGFESASRIDIMKWINFVWGPRAGIIGFFGKCLFFWIFRWDLGSGRVCNALEMAVGFKWTDCPHFEHYESILDNFVDFGHFGVVSDGLTLFSEGPRTNRDCPEGCLLYTSPSPRDMRRTRMPSSA